MMEMQGRMERVAGKDCYDFIVEVDALQIHVANTESRRLEFAHRVGELAASVAMEFMERLQTGEPAS